MFTIQKKSGMDFKILNLSDPQLGNAEWAEGHKNRAILRYTINTLIERVHPDLITITGDLSWAGNMEAYKALADTIDAFGIPWAPIWGNHDNQGGPAVIDAVADLCLGYTHCCYEKGDPALGNGNYVIAIAEEGKIVEGLIMMDSHDRENYPKPDGTVGEAWAKLYPAQLDWYTAQVDMLRKLGCTDTSVFLHIPIYAYREAWEAAHDPSVSDSIDVEQSYDPACWNEGYRDSFGVRYENISSYPLEDGAMEAILAGGTTKHVFAGHDHVNCFSIWYKGVDLVFTLKTGAGCYWNSHLNGGTVIRVTENGVADVRHEFVDVQDLVAMSDRLCYAIDTKFDLRCDADGKFRVLCVSDLHADRDHWDARLKLSLEALIRAHRPQLVFLLGDICHNEEMRDPETLRAYLADIMELCETEHIAWAHIPGNHDREDGIPTEVFSAFPMNLSRRGPAELSGYGTYALPIWHHDGDHTSGPAAMLWAFDSHTGIDAYAARHGIDPETFAMQNFPYSHDRYDSVNADQTAWYYENSAELEKIYGRKIPGVMLMHAPVAEMFLIAANPTATNMEGECREGIGGAVLNSGLFAAAYERGDIREMIAGHDHLNNLSGTYMGIRLTEDASIGFDVYGDNDLRGGRLLTFSESDPTAYESHHVFVRDLLPPETLAGPHDHN